MGTPRACPGWLIFVAFIVLTSNSASADSADDTPWGKGVSVENKANAKRLLAEGNEEFVHNRFREALAKYEAAVAQWEHPAIRFNMVRTLIALDRPLEAMTSLERALAFGKAPLEEDMYTEALNYQKLLAGQIAEYEVVCKQSGAEVKVDGEPLMTCPGSRGKKVLPGTHVVVGSRAGYLTQTKDVVLVGGTKQAIHIELVTIARGTVYRTRWATWKPWAIVGGGAAITGIGVLLNLQASADLDHLESSVRAGCLPSGCSPEEYEERGFARTESRALAQNKVAIGVMIGGGAVIASGIIAVILNRPRPFLSERREPSAQLVPSVSGDGGGLAVVGTF